MDTTTTRAMGADGRGVDPLGLGRGLAAVRIFFGVILLANGIAKVFEFRRVAVGDWWITFLIDRSFAREILDSLANKDPSRGRRSCRGSGGSRTR